MGIVPKKLSTEESFVKLFFYIKKLVVGIAKLVNDIKKLVNNIKKTRNSREYEESLNN